MWMELGLPGGLADQASDQTRFMFLEPLESRLMLTTVSTVAQLYAAVNNGVVNDTITIMPGTYVLTESLKPKAGQILDGAGTGQTIFVPAASWVPATTNLPDNGTSASTNNPAAYMIDLAGNDNIRIFDIKLDGNDQLHGAIIGNDADNLQLYNLHIEDFLWSGIRTFGMDNSVIRDSTFLNAGGRWQSGSPGVSGGVSGGAVYVTYMKTSEIANNRIYRTNTGAARGFYGIKGREARNSRIHHNTINVDFSIEFPHENDHYVEIDHNYLAGTVSIPKHGGGTLPSGSDPYTFNIHHNYFNTSYALEWARNGARIHHNLFDFDTAKDVGNLITNFAGSGNPASNGPTLFYNNLIKNPGRGIYNSNGHVYNNFSFYNNHVIGNRTITPRTEGMFGLPTTTTFSTITIKDNIFEFYGQNRPLFRNSASYASNIQNNTLINVSDSGNYSNPNTGATRGLIDPLLFQLGVNGEYTVNGWNIAPTVNTVTLNAIADAFVRAGSGYSTTNYGSSNTLTIKHSNEAIYTRMAYVKFDSSSITTPVANAKLVLTPTAVFEPANLSVRIRMLADSADGWSESAITWNNKPTGTGSAVTVAGSSLAANTPIEIDVTSLVNQSLHANGVISFHLEDPTSANNDPRVEFASREHATVSYRPKLVIEPGSGGSGSSFAQALGSGQPTLNYSNHFNNGSTAGLNPVTGTWTVQNQRYVGNRSNGWGLSVIDPGNPLPVNFDFNLIARTKATQASKNAMIIFDYVDQNNFKYAAMKDGANQWVIGQNVGGTNTELRRFNESILTDADYRLTLRIRGNTATLLVGGVQKLSHTFGNLLNAGAVALGVQKSEAVFDDLQLTAA